MVNQASDKAVVLRLLSSAVQAARDASLLLSLLLSPCCGLRGKTHRNQAGKGGDASLLLLLLLLLLSLPLLLDFSGASFCNFQLLVLNIESVSGTVVVVVAHPRDRTLGGRAGVANSAVCAVDKMAHKAPAKDNQAYKRLGRPAKKLAYRRLSYTEGLYEP